MVGAGERPYQPALDHGSIDWEVSLPKARQVVAPSSSSLRKLQIRRAPDGWLNGAQMKTSFIHQLWMRYEIR
jgi:hypothetical protein